MGCKEREEGEGEEGNVGGGKYPVTYYLNGNSFISSSYSKPGLSDYDAFFFKVHGGDLRYALRRRINIRQLPRNKMEIKKNTYNKGLDSPSNIRRVKPTIVRCPQELKRGVYLYSPSTSAQSHPRYVSFSFPLVAEPLTHHLPLPFSFS